MSSCGRSLFGAHLIVGLEGPTLTNPERDFLAEVRPIGILLLARNFLHGVSYPEWAASLQLLLREVRDITGHPSMLITIDHEGGSIVRPPLPITRFPLAARHGPKAFDVAAASADELFSLGINVTWAPIADIHSNPLNPVIGSRAFGIDYQSASKGACEYWRGLKSKGIIGCAKHFPGHGDTTTDSHFELPSVALSLDEARRREFLPFKALIDLGIPMIMTAHVLFPDIDRENPATLSPTLLSDILREELGFQGVTVADDLDMRAVHERFTSTKTMMDSLVAGCDMYIVARHIDKGLQRVLSQSEHFARGIESSSTHENLRSQSLKRIDVLVKNAPVPSPLLLSKATLERHASLSIDIAYGYEQ
jgi:beta-N-acetylhexosaminidase